MNYKNLTYEPFKSNRDKRMRPRSGLFWCSKCDRQVVGAGEKCSCCGYRLRKVLKKEKI